MTRHIVAPVDGSADSWPGAVAAIELARRTGASVTILTVAFDRADCPTAMGRLERSIADLSLGGLDIDLEVRVAAGSVAAEIEAEIDEHDDAMVVMSSHGRGRSAALVGSVADDVLHRLTTPLLLVGPHASHLDFSGPVIIAVDGSDDVSHAVNVGVDWATALGTQPWIVHAAPPETALPIDTLETGYVARLAEQAHRATGVAVEFDEVHGHRPATAVVDYARCASASTIVTLTHARTGFDRLTSGSVAAAFVRHATCPVLLTRQPSG